MRLALRHRGGVQLRRSSIVYWLVTVLAAVGTGKVVSRAVAASDLSRWGAVRVVVVAAQPVGPGHVLTAADLALRPVPVVLVPGRGVASVSAAVGRTVRRAVVVGAPVDPDLLTPSPVGNLAARTGPRRRAIAIPVSGPGLRLEAGDTVDVLSSSDGSGATEVAVAGAVVLSVTDRAVTVAVDADAAPRVAGALATRSVTLALRGG